MLSFKIMTHLGSSPVSKDHSCGVGKLAKCFLNNSEGGKSF